MLLMYTQTLNDSDSPEAKKEAIINRKLAASEFRRELASATPQPRHSFTNSCLQMPKLVDVTMQIEIKAK